MTHDEAIEIICLFERFDDVSCCCHMGNPPCTKCVELPSEEAYKEALVVVKVRRIVEEAEENCSKYLDDLKG